MNINIPELSLVALVGISSSGKSTFAQKHFKPTETISSDTCRGLVSDEENNLSATSDAFELVHFIASKRLERGNLTVIDATNLQPGARKPLVEIARKYHSIPVAIVFDLPERIAHDRNKERPERNLPLRVLRRQSQDLQRSIHKLQQEGFRYIHVLKSIEEVDAVNISRVPLWNNLKFDRGPFDLIGDVHGCYDELIELLEKLGYTVDAAQHVAIPPEGRKAVFLGDLVDRGPKIVHVLKLAMNMVAAGHALCVPGNHDIKLLRKLRGHNVKMQHGIEDSVAQLATESEDFSHQAEKFLLDLVSHYVLDDGKLVVAHAGMKESMQGRGSGATRQFALYGETTGETDEFGYPIRHNWAAEYRGNAMVVYGHTPVPYPEWLNRTINIDTGCVYGGELTALRYPEEELVSVKAQQIYAESYNPFLEDHQNPSALSSQQQHDEVLDLSDFTGKRRIETNLIRSVTIWEENATAALEIMSRFAVNPKWLIYLPPTMSPCETSKKDDWLEHPAEALQYYRNEGQPAAICQEKHMGSRAIVVVCRDADTALKRFGVKEESGIVYTRSGRRFFDDITLEEEFLNHVRDRITAAGFWEEFQSDWFCFDCEILPWSVKAQTLIAEQFASVASSGRATLKDALKTIRQGKLRGLPLDSLLNTTTERAQLLDAYTHAYQQYCWPVQSVSDLRLAPFHLLASENQVHTHKRHDWHMATLQRLSGDIIIPTKYLLVDLTQADAEKSATDWWLEQLQQGGEGMVVKPLDFIPNKRNELIQPAIKCRGKEYLRIIYGPEYTLPENLTRLRQRGLHKKRSLAIREFALGVESLSRFVRKEPHRRVHECVFGVLAMESEPVDPRL